ARAAVRRERDAVVRRLAHEAEPALSGREDALARAEVAAEATFVRARPPAARRHRRLLLAARCDASTFSRAIAMRAASLTASRTPSSPMLASARASGSGSALAGTGSTSGGGCTLRACGGTFGSGPTRTTRSFTPASGTCRFRDSRSCALRNERSLAHALVVAWTSRTPRANDTGRAFFATRW